MNSWVGGVQILAIVTMIMDHAFRFLIQAPYSDWIVFSLGRWAYPLFAGMLAWHLLVNSRYPARYLARVLLLGCVSQPLYGWMVADNFLYITRLNTLFTLAVGMIAVALLRWLYLDEESADYTRRLFRWLFLPVVIMLVWPLSVWLDYGLSGLVLVPAFYLFLRGVMERRGGQWLVGIMLLILSLYHLNPPGLPNINSAASAGLLVILALSLVRIPWIPQIPRPLWLAFYPLHLAMIVSCR